MRNDKRQFFVFDLEIGAKKNGATIPTMEGILPVIRKMKNRGEVYKIRDDTATMLIGDLEVDDQENFLVMVVRLSDKTTPESVYSDPEDGVFDIHEKTGNTGSDFACHVLISVKEEKISPNVYTCVIEKVSGIPFNLVGRIISKLLHIEFGEDKTSFSYPHPGGGLTRAKQPRMDRCCPHVEIRGRPSDELLEDLAKGTISGISLIRAEPVTPVAGAAFLKKTEYELKLSVDNRNLPENILESLKGVFKRNSDEYTKARVRYKIPGTNRTVTVDFDSKTGDILSEKYALSFEINGISPVLAQSTQTIVQHLKDLVVPRFLEHRDI